VAPTTMGVVGAATGVDMGAVAMEVVEGMDVVAAAEEEQGAPAQADEQPHQRMIQPASWCTAAGALPPGPHVDAWRG
jgi:hypothetical protein